MGKRSFTVKVAITLLVAAIIGECAAKPSSWGPQSPQLPKTPAFSADQLGIDCSELAADPNIPAFLIQELCNPQPKVPAAQTEAAEEAENAAAEEIAAEEAAVEEAAAEEAAAKEAEAEEATPEEVAAEEAVGEGGAAEEAVSEGKKAAETGDSEKSAPATQVKNEVQQNPRSALISFFRAVIQKLVDADSKKVAPKDFWVQAYQEAGAPKFSKHPSFFEIVSSLQQSIDSFRSEGSWWQVVRRLKDLTSDSQWKRLEASLKAANSQDPGALWRTLGAAKAIKSTIKTALKDPECRQEGVNPDPEDCREFYFCFRLGNRWKSKDQKCPKNLEFSPSRLRCVWAPLSDCRAEESESDSSSNSNDDSSSEILERVFKHGPAVFYHHH